MMYLIFTQEQITDVNGTYQEGNIQRTICSGRLMTNGNYALDAVLLNSQSADLVGKLQTATLADLSEDDFELITIR